MSSRVRGSVRDGAGVVDLGDHLRVGCGGRSSSRIPVVACEHRLTLERSNFSRVEHPGAGEEPQSLRRIQAEPRTAAGYDVEYELGVASGGELLCRNPHRHAFSILWRIGQHLVELES